MPGRTVECKDCDWTGDENMLERYKCPKCGSRQLRTEGSRLSHKENLNPPKEAREGEDYSSD